MPKKPVRQVNPRIERLKELFALEEKRVPLFASLKAIDKQMAAISNELYGPAARRAAAKAQAKLRPQGRVGRGELRLQILELLQAAGKTGVTIKDLSVRLGVPTTNLHSWVSINSKKLPIKRVGLARYALTGPVDALIAETQAARVRVASKAKRGRKGGKAARGALKAQILDALKQAGAKGLTVKDLAETLNVSYRNVYIWFATTGKKMGGIKKIGPAHFKLTK